MAMSPKERKQKQLEREREEQKVLPDSTYPYLRTPLHEHPVFDANISSVDLVFELMGIDPPVFEDDRGPAEFAHDACFSTDDDKEATFAGRKGAVGRAECMIHFLLDATMELSEIINRYKLNELDDRLKEIDAMDLSDPGERKRALEAVVQIEKN